MCPFCPLFLSTSVCFIPQGHHTGWYSLAFLARHTATHNPMLYRCQSAMRSYHSPPYEQTKVHPLPISCSPAKPPSALRIFAGTTTAHYHATQKSCTVRSGISCLMLYRSPQPVALAGNPLCLISFRRAARD
jgi:hypothetical protein